MIELNVYEKLGNPKVAVMPDQINMIFDHGSYTEITCIYKSVNVVQDYKTVVAKIEKFYATVARRFAKIV